MPIYYVAVLLRSFAGHANLKGRHVMRGPDDELLRTATFILMGIKFDKILVEKLMSRNVLELSSTYQAMQQEAMAAGLAQGIAKGLAEGRTGGRAEEARRFILHIGARRFGVPTAEIVAGLEAITDPEALEVILDHLLSVESWEELELHHA
ncbi:hypothetical protein [Armatimonas sp.]|uniref:hypothetical protein n=1 Tax=Armatimonas sp. TaxID=1872638 RepID=UPI0037538314